MQLLKGGGPAVFDIRELAGWGGGVGKDRRVGGGCTVSIDILPFHFVVRLKENKIKLLTQRCFTQINNIFMFINIIV